ncbi:MAG: hypothetical protein PUA68_02715 [Bacilli bacterium]|nr:hypothetical protein [Bacilli bacterium]
MKKYLILIITIIALFIINMFINDKKNVEIIYKVQTNDNHCHKANITFDKFYYVLSMDKTCKSEDLFTSFTLSEKKMNNLLNNLSNVNKMKVSDNEKDKYYIYIKVKYNKFKVVEKEGYVDKDNKIYKVLKKNIKEIGF